MTHYHFSFQTPQEASDLAKEIALFPALSAHAYIELGLNEIFFNAIEHGNLGISYEEKRGLKTQGVWDKTFHDLLVAPANQHKKVRVKLEIMPSLITIDIQDEGKGFNCRNMKTCLPQAFIMEEVYLSQKSLALIKLSLLERAIK